MHAIKYLLREHNKFRKLFKNVAQKIRQNGNPEKIYQRLTQDLTKHEKMEQKVWYPFLKKNTNLAATIRLLVTEEKKAAKAISTIKKIKSQDRWDVKVKKLKQDVEHHANEEETKLFPKVMRLVDNKNLNLIGTKMASYKKSLQKTKKR